MGDLFGSPKVESPPVPEMPKPATMPEVDDEKARAERRRRLAALQQRSGRASTVLTQQGGTPSQTMGA